MRVVHKAGVGEVDPEKLEYVLSDSSVDRYGDVIEQDGWQLANFKKNPIALFGHNASLPIGVWREVGVRDGKLKARLELLPQGKSARVDEIRAFIEAGMLRATSVGFKPLKAEPRADGAGVRYLRQELVETSIVSVPANPNALSVAKALNLSDEARSLIFGKSAEPGPTARGTPGESAAIPPGPRTTPMNLAERIRAAEENLTRLRDHLTDTVSKSDGEVLDEAQEAEVSELNTKIGAQQRSLDALRAAESSLAANSQPTLHHQQRSGDGQGRRPFAVAAKKVEPREYVYRAAVVGLLSHITKQPHDLVLRQRYGDDEATRVLTGVVNKAATVPATTTLTGWAAELAETAIGDFLDQLMPVSIYPQLAAIGGRFTFGRNGRISLPGRAATPAVGGSFVAEGAPIPVRQAGFNSATLTPKKMGVISVFTREIAEHSTPSIEAILRQAIQEDTAVAVDSVLVGAGAATATTPAGLRNGVTANAATAGGGFNAVIADLRGLIADLTAASSGNLRRPVFVMNPAQAVALSFTQNAGGQLPFAPQVEAGRLNGYPLLQSVSVPDGTVIMVDAADFFSATGDEPRFDVSDQAVLHMEDTTPAAIGTAGTPNAVAAPVRSLFQTDSLALRMLLDINWTMRRPTVAAVTGVTW